MWSMNDYKKYDPKDILLEGDLDEIVSQKTLRILKNCEPVTGSWNAVIRMGNFYFSLAWTNGEWSGPTTAGFFSDRLSPPSVPVLLESDAHANPNPKPKLVKRPKISQHLEAGKQAQSQRRPPSCVALRMDAQRTGRAGSQDLHPLGRHPSLGHESLL